MCYHGATEDPGTFKWSPQNELGAKTACYHQRESTALCLGWFSLQTVPAREQLQISSRSSFLAVKVVKDLSSRPDLQ